MTVLPNSIFDSLGPNLDPGADYPVLSCKRWNITLKQAMNTSFYILPNHYHSHPKIRGYVFTVSLNNPEINQTLTDYSSEVFGKLMSPVVILSYYTEVGQYTK
jgi:hypothetical protein